MFVLMMGLLLADAGLADYAATVTGHFSTAAQHDADPRYDIAEAEVVRIWPERQDGIWVYQEQTILNRAGITPAAAKLSPYFQRIGHIIVQPDGSLLRENYEIRDRGRFVGLWRPDYQGARPTPDDLGPAGCANYITRVAAGHFTAVTKACENHYKGAAAMLSLAISAPDTYANWDRGFDAAGARVWGPAEGGYLFRRKP